MSWDIFIAHAGADRDAAEALYDAIDGRARVFLDVRCLALGDDWDLALAGAQRASLMSVVLVSSRTDRAYYQREEIAAAVDLARRTAHRVVPVYLDAAARDGGNVPYGLRLKHGLAVDPDTDIDDIADRIVDALARLRKQGEHDTAGPDADDANTATRTRNDVQHAEAGTWQPPRRRGLAQSWARTLVTLGVGVAVGLAPYLGTLDVPLFRPLLDLIPDSLRDTTIPLSAALMGLVAVAVEWYGRERPSPTLMRWGFAGTLVAALIALLAFMWVQTSTVVTVRSGSGSATSFVVGSSRPATCGCPPAISDEQCINGLSWNESAITECWGDRQVRRAGLMLRLTYLLTTGLFGALVGFLAIRRR